MSIRKPSFRPTTPTTQSGNALRIAQIALIASTAISGCVGDDERSPEHNTNETIERVQQAPVVIPTPTPVESEGSSEGSSDGSTLPAEPDPRDLDEDNDGFTPNTGDCDDTNNAVNPSADETCNDIDDDCDGTIDNITLGGYRFRADTDGDRYPDGTETIGRTCDLDSIPSALVAWSDYAIVDCAPNDPQISPGADDLPTLGDGLDTNCNGIDANAVFELFINRLPADMQFRSTMAASLTNAIEHTLSNLSTGWFGTIGPQTNQSNEQSRYLDMVINNSVVEGLYNGARNRIFSDRELMDQLYSDLMGSDEEAGILREALQQVDEEQLQILLNFVTFAKNYIADPTNLEAEIAYYRELESQDRTSNYIETFPGDLTNDDNRDFRRPITTLLRIIIRQELVGYKDDMNPKDMVELIEGFESDLIEIISERTGEIEGSGLGAE